MQQLGQIGQRMQVLLELTLWDEKEHHQMDWLTIQSFEFNTSARTSNDTNDF